MKRDPCRDALDHAITGRIEANAVRVALTGAVPRAADRLGMAPVSLSRWIDRRELPRIASGAGVTHAAR